MTSTEIYVQSYQISVSVITTKKQNAASFGSPGELGVTT
jgi:hypothetical protein